MGHFESLINYKTVSRSYKARSFNISILVICIADTVLSESETVFSRGFVTFFFPQLPPEKVTNPSHIFSSELFRKFDPQYWAVEEDCIFVRLVKFYGKLRCLKIYHLVGLVVFSTDSFDDAAIFVRVFCYPFCAFSVRLPGGSLGPFVTRFAAVIWLETGSLIMFNTIKIAIARHNHGILDMLQSPKVWKR